MWMILRLSTMRIIRQFQLRDETYYVEHQDDARVRSARVSFSFVKTRAKKSDLKIINSVAPLKLDSFMQCCTVGVVQSAIQSRLVHDLIEYGLCRTVTAKGLACNTRLDSA